MENIEVDQGFLLLEEHRGVPFVKMIRLDAKMVDVNVKCLEDATVRIRVNEKNANMANNPRPTLIMWVNAAQPLGGDPFDFRGFVRNRILQHRPHLLILTSSHQAYSGHRMAPDMTALGGRANHFENAGIDGSAICIGTASGVIAGTGGVTFEDGYDLTYGHIYVY